jgi:hypothetical protein
VHARPKEIAMPKDSLTFALILSVIDYLLCFVMVAGIGLIIYLLRFLNRFGSLDEKKMRL